MTLEWRDDHRGCLVSPSGRRPFAVAVDGSTLWLRWEGRTYRLAREAPETGATPSGEGTPDTRARMPGVVLSIHVSPGDEVPRGALLLTLEAMKMEHEVRAARRSRVISVLVAVGERVEAETALLELETIPEDEAAATPPGRGAERGDAR